MSLVLVQELALGVACGCRWPCPRPPGGYWVVGEVVDVLSLFMNGEQMSQNKGEQLSQNGG